MKTARKILMALLCCVLLAATALLAVACDTGYSVAVEFEQTQGTVAVSAPSDGKAYRSREKVTVTVEPANGYEVDQFTVNGNAAELVEGKYIFEITEDTLVKVTFRDVRPAEYTVDVQVSPSEGGGTAELSPSAQNGLYAEGETVVLTVTPATGYVANVTLNGQPVNLIAGKYSFEVQTDSHFVVTFTALADKVLQSLRGTLLFDGECVETDFAFNEKTSKACSALFDATHRAVLLQRWYGAAVEFVRLHKDVDGKAALVSHDEDGVVSNQTTDIDFADIFNPFELLTADDIEMTEKGVWKISDPEKAAKTAKALTGRTEQIENVELYDIDGEAVRVAVILPRVQSGKWIDYQTVYTFEVTGRGEVIPDEWFQTYQATAAHSELTSALQAAAQADSYKAVCRVEEDGGKPYTYNIYYTPQGIYQDLEGQQQGWFVRADGVVWGFDYDAETQQVTPNMQILENSQGLDYLKAIFDRTYAGKEFANLLESKGDGVFELRPIDVAVDFDSTGIAEQLGQAFATGVTQVLSFAKASAVKVTVRQGALYQVELYYNYYGSERVTLTFEEWDTATLPITIDDAARNGSVPANFVGSWTSEHGDVKLEMSLDGIKLNNDRATSLNSLQEGGVQFTVSDVTYTVTAQDNAVFLSGGKYVSEKLVQCDWSFFIADYFTQSGEAQNFTLQITAWDFVITQNGGQVQRAQVTGFERYTDGEDKYYRFTVKFGDADYVLDQKDDGDDNVWLWYASGQTRNDGVTVLRNRREALQSWNNRLGTYVGGGYTLTIEADKLTFGDANGNKTFAADQFVYYSDWDYQNERTFYRFEFEFDGKQALVQPSSSGNYMTLTIGDVVCRLIDSEYKQDWTGQEGNFEGVSNNVKYTLEITDTTVFLTIGDGDKTEAQNLFYDTSEGFLFAVNGVEYRFKSYFNSWGNLEFGGDSITLNYVEPQPELPDWKDYIGTFEGISDGKTYTVRITAEGLTLSVDGVESVAQDLSFESVSGLFGSYDEFTFTIDGVEYSLMSDNDSHNSMTLSCDETDLYVMGMTRKKECAWQKYVGTFEGTSGGKTYVVAITEDGLTVAIDGVEIVAQDLSFDTVSGLFGAYDEFTFTLDGNGYTLDSDDDVGKKMTLSADDWSVYASLERTDGGGESYKMSEQIIGKWRTADGSIEVVITEDSVTINGEEVADMEIDQFGEPSFTWKGKLFLTTTYDGQSMDLFDEEMEEEYTLNRVE